jgi:hypothetical protein
MATWDDWNEDQYFTRCYEELNAYAVNPDLLGDSEALVDCGAAVSAGGEGAVQRLIAAVVAARSAASRLLSGDALPQAAGHHAAGAGRHARRLAPARQRTDPRSSRHHGRYRGSSGRLLRQPGQLLDAVADRLGSVQRRGCAAPRRTAQPPAALAAAVCVLQALIWLTRTRRHHRRANATGRSIDSRQSPL